MARKLKVSPFMVFFDLVLDLIFLSSHYTNRLTYRHPCLDWLKLDEFNYYPLRHKAYEGRFRDSYTHYSLKYKVENIRLRGDPIIVSTFKMSYLGLPDSERLIFKPRTEITSYIYVFEDDLMRLANNLIPTSNKA